MSAPMGLTLRGFYAKNLHLSKPLNVDVFLARGRFMVPVRENTKQGSSGAAICFRRASVPRKWTSLLNWPIKKTGSRHFSHSAKKLVLGIETSCDDTGAAVVNDQGIILGEALRSQTHIHVELGGIIPPVARDLHRANIEAVVETALQNANVTLQDLDAIATTVKPGLPASLLVGLHYSKRIIKETGKPFMPIHHMEAHALTARMIERVDFPFLVLLISGGHTLLAVAQNVEDFLLLGKGLDNAPGDVLDKTARTLKLKNVSECDGLSGGAAIELMARTGNPHAFKLKPIMTHIPNCNFSFSGLKSHIHQVILKQEKLLDMKPGQVLPNVSDICATMQYWVLHHLAKRLQRALMFCELKQLLPDSCRTLVVSGGVASNSFIRQGLERVCAAHNCRLICPPPKLCTDNGIMIAWNGMEKLKIGKGLAEKPDTVDIHPKCQFGKDVTEEVQKCSIKVPRVKLLE